MGKMRQETTAQTRQPKAEKKNHQAEKVDRKALNSINQMQHRRLAMSLNDRQKKAGTTTVAAEAKSVRPSEVRETKHSPVHEAITCIVKMRSRKGKTRKTLKQPVKSSSTSDTNIL